MCRVLEKSDVLADFHLIADEFDPARCVVMLSQPRSTGSTITNFSRLDCCVEISTRVRVRAHIMGILSVPRILAHTARSAGTFKLSLMPFELLWLF